MIFYVKNDEIVQGPLHNYPKVVTGPKGVQYPLRELASKGYPVDQHGWVEYTAPEPKYNPNTHKLGEVSYSVVDGKVTGQYNVVPLSPKERSGLQARETERQTKDDAALKNFLNAGPQGIDAYISKNVNDLASAKQVLSLLGRIVWVMSHDRFEQ